MKLSDLAQKFSDYDEKEKAILKRKNKKPRPSTRFRTQSFINIRDVSDGIIITNDDRYIRIIEIVPTNFFNKDALEQERIVYQFAQYLNHAPRTMQIKVMSVPETAEDYLKVLRSYKNLPNATKQTREMVDDLAAEIKDTVEIYKLTANRFFVIYEFEEFQMSPDFNYVRKILLGHELALAECMERCGCKVVNPRLTDNQYINTVLYEYILMHFDRMAPDFETQSLQIYQEIADRNPMKVDSLTIEDYLSPKEVAFYDRKFCEVNGKYVSYHYISDYRHRVTAGWLNPLLSSSYDVDVDIFFVREDRRKAKTIVRRSVDMQELVLENINSNTSVAMESRQNMQDALLLREKMYSESADMYYLSVLVTISADELDVLDDKIREVYNLMETKDMPLLPLDLRQEEGFRSTLPFVKLDKDVMRISSRNILCGELASVFPFNEPSIFDEGGIFIGKNKAGRFCAINNFDTTKYDKPHMMFLGSTGSGKTYAGQLMIGRSRMAGAKCFAIAPIKGEEYRRFCENIGGQFIKFTTEGTNHVNIFDIRLPKDEIASALIESDDTGYLGQKSYLSRKLIVVSAYFEILMPYLTPLQQSLLNVAIVDAYKAKGITRDNRSILNEDGSYKEMPIISDVCIALKDILRLFDLSKIDYTHGLRSMLNNHIKVVEHGDYVAVEYFPGYEASKKYMNTISALVAIKNQHKNVIITDDSYSTLFTAKMYIRDEKTDDVRTYYVIDTQFLDIPFYVLQDLIKNELDNGYSKKNRLIIIVYPDTEVEHISLDIPIFLALIQFSEKDISINFYDNKQL